MDIQASYKILGISQNVNFDAIKAAHRKMIKQYHPDRFVADIDAKQRAEEQSKLINVAYQTIKMHIESDSIASFVAASTRKNEQPSSTHWAYAWTADDSKSTGTYYRRGYEGCAGKMTARVTKWCRMSAAIKVAHSLFFMGMIGVSVVSLGLVEKVSHLNLSMLVG